MATKKTSNAKLYKMQFRNLMEVDQKTELHSFQILPVSSDCPIEGAIYDPSNKTLVIKTKSSQDETQVVRKMNSNGSPVIVKSKNGYAEAKERIKLLSILENRITVREEIIDYVETLCGTVEFIDGTKLQDQLDKLDNFTIKSNSPD
jgi:hypothetical protein